MSHASYDALVLTRAVIHVSRESRGLCCARPALNASCGSCELWVTRAVSHASYVALAPPKMQAMKHASYEAREPIHASYDCLIRPPTFMTAMMHASYDTRELRYAQATVIGPSPALNFAQW